MMRTLSIGGATYDVFVRTGADLIDAKGKALTLPLGGKIRVKDVIEAAGGGAANTAVGLSRLGCDAAFCGVIGSDQWGDRMRESLTRERVDTRSATVVDGETSSFSVILSAGSGERVILYAVGTNAHLGDATFDRDAVRSRDWIYLNHLHEESCEITDDVVDGIAANAGVRLTWNPGGCQIERGIRHTENAALLRHTTLLLVNKEEALAFSGAKSAGDALTALRDAGVKNVCITDGSRGCIATDGATTYRCPVLPDTTVIDTTGAGDAFGSGCTWALLAGRDLPTALRAGTLNAASVVAVIGAQSGLLTHTQMQTLLQETSLSVTSSSTTT